MDKEVKEKKVCKQQVVFCVLVVLYVFVLLLFSLPVHAAESSTIYTYTLDLYKDLPSKQHSEFHDTYNTPYSKVVAYRYQTSGTVSYTHLRAHET